VHHTLRLCVGLPSTVCASSFGVWVEVAATSATTTSRSRCSKDYDKTSCFVVIFVLFLWFACFRFDCSRLDFVSNKATNQNCRKLKVSLTAAKSLATTRGFDAPKAPPRPLNNRIMSCLRRLYNRPGESWDSPLSRLGLGSSHSSASGLSHLWLKKVERVRSFVKRF
jgi:hypothetical protein